MKKKHVVPALAGLLAMVVIVLLWPGEQEPEYQGKKLSEWAEVYEASFHPATVDSDPPEESAERRQAVEAAHHVRDMLLPRALKMVPYEKPAWKGNVERFMELRLNVRRWCPLWIWAPFYGDRGEDNLVYFEMLGPDAGPAIPELDRIMTSAASPRIRERAMYALASIGGEGLPPLLQVLADPRNPDRRQAAFAISYMKNAASLASPAVPLLVKHLKDPDENTAWAAAMVLGSLAIEPGIAVPALTNCLQSTNESFREVAVENLAKFREQARSALPALLRALSDTNGAMREEATNALLNIAPEVLPKEARMERGEEEKHRD